MTGTGEPRANHGIVIGGNARVGDSALAAGDGAVAHRTGPGSTAADGALAALGELTRRLETWEDTEAARAEAEALAREVAAGQPDGERVERRLARLRALLGDATALTGLVTAVHASVRAITGG